MLIGLCGYATVGKDAIAAALPGFRRAAFADALKADLAPLRAMLPPHTKTDIRPLMVEWGRTCRRIDPQHWLKRIHIPAGDVVVTDVRYVDEAEFLLMEHGATIFRVGRPGIGAANAEEEKSIDEIDRRWPFLPRIDNDSTIESAAAKVLGVIGKV